MDIVFNYSPNGQSDKKEKEKYHLFTMCRYRVAVTYRAIVSFPPPTV